MFYYAMAPLRYDPSQRFAKQLASRGGADGSPRASRRRQSDSRTWDTGGVAGSALTVPETRRAAPGFDASGAENSRRIAEFRLDRPDDLECPGAIAIGSEAEGFGIVVGIGRHGPRRSAAALRMALSSRLRSIGLVKWSKNPASRLWRRSSSAPKPLMAMPAIGSVALISRMS